MSITIGIIGGSGLYDMAELTNRHELTIDTPFGAPSGPYITGTIAGARVAFLARHGAGHRIMPSELNFRANIYGFKTLGVERILSASAVGSLRGHLAAVAHDAAVQAGARVHKGGTYVCMEGPAFSTRAESNLYRSWGAQIIGMTNLQEAKLAREAEICYATIALVTDYDCWHPDHDHVTVEMIIDHLTQNARTAQRVIAGAVTTLAGAPRTCGCGQALATAIITRPDAVPEATRLKLAPIMGKYLDV
jgi:5'-methylthioadenosine phosphorylase